VRAEPQSCERRWGEELAAYALDALDADAARGVTEHLAGCPRCEERLRWLSAAVDLLPASVPQYDPPPALRQRLMAAALEQATGRADPASARPTLRARVAGWFAIPGVRPAIAGLAATLLIVAGLVGYQLRGDDGGDSTVSATALAPYSGASGALVVNGDRGDLHVAGLPTLGKGQVYQAWIATGEDIEPSSVFVLAKDGTGEVSIPHGLSGADQVMVTREPSGGSTKPSTNPLISATVD
jgi:hypothetical protein